MACKQVTVDFYKLHKISHRTRVLIAYHLGPRHNWSPTEIRKDLIARGCRLVPSLKAISLFGRRYRASDSVADKPRSGRPTRLNKWHENAIDRWIRCNRDITIDSINKNIQTVFGLKVSLSCIRRKILQLGWKKKRTRYCQMIRQTNKFKRFVYSLMCRNNNEDFKNCVFTDEASIEVMRSGRLRFIHKNESTVIAKVAKPKHPFKVHVWAGISWRGATEICIFGGNMASPNYQQILENYLVPFLKKAYPDGHRLIQDNDPKHTSNSTKVFMREFGIFHWRTPPESPDLNPIELVWSLLKRRLAKDIQPTNKEELVKGITAVWATVTPALCRNYINHLKVVIPHVIARDGAASGF